MMNKLILSAIGGLALLSASVVANAMTIDFSSLQPITFNSAQDTFTLGNFQVTNPGGGITGSIGGTYKIGPISSTPIPPFVVEQAAVTTQTPGKFTLQDGAAIFSADVSFSGIYTLAGAAGILGQANLTNFTLNNNTSATLNDFYSAGVGSTQLSFQFAVQGVDLTDLVSSGGSASWSGSATAVPVPAAAWLFGSALLGLVGVARRRSSNV